MKEQNILCFKNKIINKIINKIEILKFSFFKSEQNKNKRLDMFGFKKKIHNHTIKKSDFLKYEINSKIQECQSEIIRLFEYLLNKQSQSFYYKIIKNKPSKNNPYLINYVHVRKINSKRKNVYKISFFNKGNFLNQPNIIPKKIKDKSITLDQHLLDSIQHFYCLLSEWRDIFTGASIDQNYKFGEVNNTFKEVNTVKDLELDYEFYKKYTKTQSDEHDENENLSEYDVILNIIYRTHIFISIMYSLLLDSQSDCM